MAKELISRYQFCTIPVADLNTSGFHPNNVGKDLPVSLAGVVPTGDTGLPRVEITKGAATANQIYGKFTGINNAGSIAAARVAAGETLVQTDVDNVIVTIAVDGEDMRFARQDAAPAVGTADIGRGIEGAAANVDGSVVSAARSVRTRGIIIGGNVAAASAGTNGFFRVNFRSS